MKKILVIAPHPDDEILGCGGMMIENIKHGNEVTVCIVTQGMPPIFTNIEGTKKNQADARKCHQLIGVKETIFLGFPSTMLETVPRYEFNGRILKLVRDLQPDEVYIPHWGDMQKDHQIVADACMVAVRPKYTPPTRKVYAYETMSETAWNAPNVQNTFIPNVFIDISDSLEAKKEALKQYTLQISAFPDARSLESIDSLARYRGAQMNMRAAEAFVLVRELKTIE